jgi:hypothetical protein
VDAAVRQQPRASRTPVISAGTAPAEGPTSPTSLTINNSGDCRKESIMFEQVNTALTPSSAPSVAPGPDRCGFARGFDTATLARLLGRSGRVADTAHSEHYAAIFGKLAHRFGRRLRFGFMVPMNLVVEGIVRHPMYMTKRLPQLAPLVLFKQENDSWTARAVVSVTTATEGDTQHQILERLTTLYADCGVEHLVIGIELLQSGYLDTGDFKRRLGRAVYSPCVLPPQPLPTPRRSQPHVAA